MRKKINYCQCLRRETAIQIFRKSPLTIESQTYFLWVVALCLLSLISALMLEYIGGYPPCSFCIYERWPYVIAFVASLLGIFTKRPPIDIGAMFICMVAFFIGTALSLYHVGMEHHWFPMPKACTGGDLSSALSFDELKTLVLKRKIVPCDQVPIRFLGFSLVEYNLVFSFILFICSFRLTLKFFQKWQIQKSK